MRIMISSQAKKQFIILMLAMSIVTSGTVWSQSIKQHSLRVIEIGRLNDDTLVGGTGFVLKHKDIYFFVTNFHVVREERMKKMKGVYINIPLERHIGKIMVDLLKPNSNTVEPDSCIIYMPWWNSLKIMVPIDKSPLVKVKYGGSQGRMYDMAVVRLVNRKGDVPLESVFEMIPSLCIDSRNVAKRNDMRESDSIYCYGMSRKSILENAGKYLGSGGVVVKKDVAGTYFTASNEVNQGDSGTPVFVKKNNRYLLAGLLCLGVMDRDTIDDVGYGSVCNFIDDVLLLCDGLLSNPHGSIK